MCQARFVHKDGSLRVIESVRTNLLHDPAVRAVVTNFRDITERESLLDKLQRHAAFQQLLMTMAATYINLPIDAIDNGIQHSLQDLATFVGADRAWIYSYDFDRQTFSNTHEWCAEGVEPTMARQQGLPLATFPTTVAAHRRGEPVYVDALSLAPGPRRDFLAAQGIRNLLAIPVMIENSCVGSVGLDGVNKPFAYSDDEVQLLVFFAHMLASVRHRQLMESKMRANEQRYRALIEHSYSAFSLMAVDGTVLYDSPTVFAITGYSPGERLGRNAFEFVYPPDRQAAEQSFLELVPRTGAVASCQMRSLHKNGKPRLIESVRTNLLHDPAVRAVVTNFRDITERQQMAEALQKSEQRFRALIENSQDAIILLAADGTILYDSPSLFRILGYAPEERLGRKAYDFVCPEDRRKLEQSFFELVPRTGAVDSYEARYLHKDGTPLAVEVVRTNLLHDPAVQAVVINFRDITKRRQAEKELRENEAKLSLALHASQMGVWELDIAGDRRMFDDQVCSLLGLDPARFTGSEAEFFAVVHPDDRDKIKQMRNTSIAQGVPYDADYRVVRPDGSIRYIRARGNLVRDEEGKPLKINGVIWDTTERWQGEKEQEKLQAQLVQAQKMESVGRLAGGVAHDFNNMLMVILGNAELCQDTVEPAHPGYTALEEIIKGANHAQSLTSQLLAFARKQPIAPHVLDLNATISNMLNLLRRLIGEDVMIIWQPDAALWPVTLDPSQIDQILTNLIINARDAIQGTGTITIETRNTTLDQPYCDLHAGATPGNYVLLTVSDTGCGMDRETLAHIFEPFFTTKAFGKGTGLGLSMVYGIVKQNNGFISVYSEPGQGTQFKIYWPYVLGENAHPAIGHAPAAAVGGDETILLVEDEEAVRAIARNFLSSLGYTVLAAEDPEKALRLAAEHPGEIQLLLTDVIMPGMNGRDLAQRLSEIRPSMKRLFISGFTADVLTQRGILADGLNFLGKPFTRDKLARKVREALTA